MSRRDSSEKKRYNTQELLSMNMARLKEYMKAIAKESEDPGSMPVIEMAAPAAKSTTRLVKRPSNTRILCISYDPFFFVSLIAANDKRLNNRRYALERASDVKEAIAKLSGSAYDAVALSDFEVGTDEPDARLGAADFILMVHGQARAGDMYFPGKKRWFVLNMIPGGSNQEKLDNFRKIKEKYARTPFVYLPDKIHESDAEVLKCARKARVIQDCGTEFEQFFRQMDELSAGC